MIYAALFASRAILFVLLPGPGYDEDQRVSGKNVRCDLVQQFPHEVQRAARVIWLGLENEDASLS